MYYKIIELLPKEHGISYDEVKDLIWHFLFALECSGQILKTYRVIQEKNLSLHVTTPKEDSLSECYDSIYVKGDREKMLSLFEIRTRDCGIDLGSQEYCSCKKRGAMEMQTFNFDIDSVFTCCDCGKPIALYELPYQKNNDDRYNIQQWQSNFSSMDSLWMNCLCDRYTGNQRVKLDSALNKQGIMIAEYIGKQVDYPVFYHLECDYGKSIKAEKIGDQQIHICPKCGKLMKRVRFSENHERDICEKCKLSYDAH